MLLTCLIEIDFSVHLVVIFKIRLFFRRFENNAVVLQLNIKFVQRSRRSAFYRYQRKFTFAILLVYIVMKPSLRSSAFWSVEKRETSGEAAKTSRLTRTPSYAG